MSDVPSLRTARRAFAILNLDEARKQGLPILLYSEVGRMLFCRPKTIRNVVCLLGVERVYLNIRPSRRRRAGLPWDSVLRVAEYLRGPVWRDYVAELGPEGARRDEPPPLPIAHP